RRDSKLPGIDPEPKGPARARRDRLAQSDSNRPGLWQRPQQFGGHLPRPTAAFGGTGAVALPKSAGGGTSAQSRTGKNARRQKIGGAEAMTKFALVSQLSVSPCAEVLRSVPPHPD